MNFALSFLWKNIHILILSTLLGIIVYGVVDYFNQKDKMALLTKELTECTSRNIDMSDELATLRAAFEHQKVKIKEAEVKRQEIAKKLSAQVNSLRKQEPPKECKAAIDWAVLNKSDLSWPK